MYISANERHLIKVRLEQARQKRAYRKAKHRAHWLKFRSK